MWGGTRKALEMAQSALDRSSRVDAQFAAHDVRCTERWKEARDAWDRVEKAVESMRVVQTAQATALVVNKSTWMGPTITALGATVVLLLGSLGTLMFYLVTHGH